jgi:hypothetical protein
MRGAAFDDRVSCGGDETPDETIVCELLTRLSGALVTPETGAAATLRSMR